MADIGEEQEPVIFEPFPEEFPIEAEPPLVPTPIHEPIPA